MPFRFEAEKLYLGPPDSLLVGGEGAVPENSSVSLYAVYDERLPETSIQNGVD